MLLSAVISDLSDALKSARGVTWRTDIVKPCRTKDKKNPLSGKRIDSNVTNLPESFYIHCVIVHIK
jgi:hypothetical protein